MQKPSEQQATDDAPLYIRWNPDRSPYAIELKLDLVSKILNEMAQAQRVGIEVGGILIGALPAEYAPTLRIDDVEIVPRSPDDGPIYMLDPGQHERFSQIRWKPRAAGRVAIGFFRSHLRPGSLRPSLADRSLLSAEFKQPVYAVLLIQGAEPRTAAFFLATNGRFSEEPAVREFRFDEAEFSSLPEIPAEAAPPERRSETKRPVDRRFYAQIAALLLIGVGACVLLWFLGGRTALPQWFSSRGRLELAVTPRNRILRISWNHAASEFAHASGGTLAIHDGTSRREIKLGLDELRLGAVDYEQESPRVEVTMTLDAPDSPAPESVDWIAR